MRGTQLAELLDGDLPGVGEALDLVAGFDDSLVHGFARLGEERAAALTTLAGAVAATPLGEWVGEAVGKITAGSVADEHLTALAGARAALLGAVHDALLARLDTALGRTRAPWETPQPPAPDLAATDNLRAGCRSWLTELAITGWRGVENDLISGASQALEALLAEPGLRRLAVLLDGLAAELRASSPVATMDRVPARRWGDLWARALLLSQGWPGGTEPADVLSGRLLVLGVDVHEHSTAVQVQVHGVLEAAGGAPPRLVRTSVAAAKVDTIVGPAVWRLLHGYPVLLGALTERRSLDITDMPLRASGDLVWHDDQASAGDPADPFATARVQLGAAVAPAVPPLDRHPVRIAEPVLMERYNVTADASNTVIFELDGKKLAVDIDRLPTCGPLTPKLVADSTACLGLLRWDGGRWSLQPFGVQKAAKKKTTAVHTGDWALDPKAAKSKTGDPVAVLRERAGKLLRN